METLYAEENRGRAEPSGTQDMIGLIYPGVSRLDYDAAYRDDALPGRVKELLGLTASLVLRCNHRGAQFAFAGDKPKYVADVGEPCIQCELPTTMLGMQQRRRFGRIEVPAEATVRCDLRIGQQVFASRLIDVSLDGICALITDPMIPLCAGTRLESARVRHAEAEPFLVDLEVRDAGRVTLPNGKPASRVGCKVLGSREVLEELIRLFIVDLA